MEKKKDDNCLNLSIPIGQYYDVVRRDWSGYAPNNRESHQSGIDSLLWTFSLLPLATEERWIQVRASMALLKGVIHFVSFD